MKDLFKQLVEHCEDVEARTRLLKFVQIFEVDVLLSTIVNIWFSILALEILENSTQSVFVISSLGRQRQYTRPKV